MVIWSLYGDLFPYNINSYAKSPLHGLFGLSFDNACPHD